MAEPQFVEMNESEWNATFGAGSKPASVVPVTTTQQGPMVVEMDESEWRSKFGGAGENFQAGVGDIPSQLIQTPASLYTTLKGSLRAIDNVFTSAPLDAEERQGLRNLASIGGSTAGAMGGAPAGAALGALGGPLAPATVPLGALLGGWIGGSVGSSGVDYVAEKAGIDAPRTGQERINQLAYNLGGGIAGDLALRGVGAATRAIRAPVTSIGSASGARQAAANVLSDTYGPQAAAQLNEALQTPVTGPLDRYRTTAEVLQSPEAAALQKSLESSNFKTDLGTQAVEREAARQSLLNQMAPETASVVDLQQAIGKNLDELRYTAGAAEKALPPTIDPGVAGEGLRDILQSNYRTAGTATNEAFAAIPDWDKLEIPTGEAAARSQALASRLFGPGSEGAPSTVTKLLDTLAPREFSPNEVVGFTADDVPVGSGDLPRTAQYLQNLRSWAGEEASQFYTKDKNRAGAVASGVVREIDDAFAKAESEGLMTPEQRTAYREALDMHRKKVETFERGPVGRVLRKGDGVEGFNVEPSAVGRQFWNSSQEAMKGFGRALAGDMKAQELLVRDAITDFKQKIVNPEGKVSASKIKKWVNDHQAFLDVFPDLKRNVDALYVAEAKSALKTDAFGKFVEANPEQAMSVVMTGKDSGRKARLLRREIGDKPELMEAARRGVIDNLNQRLLTIDNTAMKPNAYKRFMEQHKSVIGELFSKEHIKHLDGIYADLASDIGVEELASRASRFQSATMQKTTLYDALKKQVTDELGTVAKILGSGKTVGATLGGTYGYARGGVEAGLIGTAAGGYVGQLLTNITERAQVAVMKELDRAAANPRYARELLEQASKGKVSEFRRMLDPKINPIRQMIISSYLSTRDDQEQANQQLAEALQQSGQPAAAAAPEIEALASALGENEPGMVVQEEQTFNLPEMGQKATLTKTSMVKTGSSGRIDPRLVDQVIWKESRGRVNAVGPLTKYGRAKGQMQLLDSTGEELHKRLGLPGKYDPFNAEQNRTIGTAYLEQLSDRYNGSVPLALAAYNWGMGNLDRAFDKIGSRGPMELQAFLEEETMKAMRTGAKEPAAKRIANAKMVETFGVDVILPYLPAETRDYVTTILQRYESRAKNKNVVKV